LFLHNFLAPKPPSLPVLSFESLPQYINRNI
jgi:hypothetical protein